MTEKLVSKILVLDEDAAHAAATKRFCDENGLVGLKVRRNRLLSVLRSNIDLGAILMAESYGGSIEESERIAIRIRALRPELPIILRREQRADLAHLPDDFRRAVCAGYRASDVTPLRTAIDEYIFSVTYPNALVRGISEITESVLSCQFRDLSVAWDTPYIVRDRLIFGEVFSLITLESNWCRGYMMLQTEEDPLLEMLVARQGTEQEAGFRDVNSLLGEITNMIWGAFKNRYIGDASALAGAQTQVPLIVNHRHKYISFGTENPQLCFLYRLTDEQSGRSVKLYQRFVFNLSWSPEDFKEIVEDVDSMVDAGELELF